MIRHLLATDLRRFRWTLTAWGLLVTANAALLWITPGYVVDPPRHNTLATALVLLFLITHLTPLVLVPLIVQADAPVGSDVFWATRPVPPRALLVAKTILIGLVILLLPLLFELAAMVAAHVPRGEIVRIAVDTIIDAGLWISILMVASAITASYPRFALLCASAVVAAACWIIVMEAIVRNRAQGPFALVSVGMGPVHDTRDATAFLVFAAGLMLSACALLVLQYRRRQRLVSIPAGAGGLVLAILAAGWWPWPLPAPRETLPAWTATDPRLSAASPVIRFDHSFADSSSTPWRFGHLDLRVAPVAPGWVAAVTLRDAALTLPDGTVVGTRTRGFMAVPPAEGTGDPQQRAAVSQLLSVAHLADPHGEKGDTAIAIAIELRDYLRLQSTTMVYRGTFVVDLIRFEVAGRQPLAPGAMFDDGAYQLKLLDMGSAGGNAVTYGAIQTAATSMLDPGPQRSYAVYAVNRSRSEALEAMVFPMSPANEVAGFGVHGTFFAGPGFMRRGVRVIFPQTYSSKNVVLDDDWLKAAELVLVRRATVGHVVRNIEVGGVTACSPERKC